MQVRHLEDDRRQADQPRHGPGAPSSRQEPGAQGLHVEVRQGLRRPSEARAGRGPLRLRAPTRAPATPGPEAEGLVSRRRRPAPRRAPRTTLGASAGAARRWQVVVVFNTAATTIVLTTPWSMQRGYLIRV